MSDQQVRMIVLSTDNLEESIKFYTETLGFPLKFRDGAFRRFGRRLCDTGLGHVDRSPHTGLGRRWY
jgi:catechol 2,3-dioxygenase-like lactoylglutathione lyase family enzyme